MRFLIDTAVLLALPSRCPLSTQGLRVAKPRTPRDITIAPMDIVGSLIRERFQFLRKIVEPSTVSRLIPVGRCKSLCHRRCRGHFRIANATRLCPTSRFARAPSKSGKCLPLGIFSVTTIRWRPMLRSGASYPKARCAESHSGTEIQVCSMQSSPSPLGCFLSLSAPRLFDGRPQRVGFLACGLKSH
jgi:hypothetical protein